jgi:hypothetical protein
VTKFRRAIEQAEHLHWKPGLSAITSSEGKGQVVPADAKSLLGSAAIDTDSQSVKEKFFSQGARWDYVVGVQRTRDVAHFIEVHSADTSGVSEVEKKLFWLFEFLQRAPQEQLAGLARELHWVASGRINIPKHLPQFKKLETKLRKLGLKGPVKHLDLG